MNTREGATQGPVPSYNFGVSCDIKGRARVSADASDAAIESEPVGVEKNGRVPAAARRGARGGGSGL